MSENASPRRFTFSWSSLERLQTALMAKLERPATPADMSAVIRNGMWLPPPSGWLWV